ncbi:riboflavin biosynthesis protein RibF [Putridiphycobacter roseus]|uniref:Riboflavin biosynthesis protein n=1 Tax=Putridiphycobacter roseus TaxID=2219161 RepID=A0A2W1N2J0_9FLAO|nr:bifunctional riboflavin kinase/FAD synthetase [Putridiphycobacter roseus]PZE18517.1 riboflavin biosynthesis protein RibF [Putridiphycobacter roseus]
MNIYTDLSEFPSLKNPVVTIGTFDGVHLGHQEIITYLKAKAQAVDGTSVVFTFHPHPRVILRPNDHGLKLIQTIEERVEKLALLGVDHLVIFPFSIPFSKLSAEEFVRTILIDRIKMHSLVIGYDHHFGKNREGSLAALKKLSPIYNFNIYEVGPFQVEGLNISSTKIRNAIDTGAIEKVNKFLGEAFQLRGKVVHGDKIGQGIGFPTANIELGSSLKLVPSNGVYAVKIKLGTEYYTGMLNIGNRPTIKAHGEKRIEVHIFDFNQNIYGDDIVVYFVSFVRDEINFESRDALVVQLKKDEKNCRNIFARITL